jgi:hypothetical protein
LIRCLFSYESIIRIQLGKVLMGGRDMTLPVNRGTVFRYRPQFRYPFQYNGIGFRYIDLSRGEMIVNRGIEEWFSVILQSTQVHRSIAYSSSAMSWLCCPDHAVRALLYAIIRYAG